jgi:hypothetical protein
MAVATHAAEPDPTAASLAPECPPFDAEPIVPPAPIRESGVAPSVPPSPSTGSFVSLPIAPAEVLGDRRGEVLLALPKRADGSISTDFELAPGARVASSYFSPVLCSTLVRVVGARNADPAALIRSAPKGAAVVRNDIYVTAAAELRPAGAGRDPYRDLQYSLDAEQVDAARPVTDGTGARVAVLDSAPDPGHRDLTGLRVLAVEGGPPAAAPAKHGSLVAGILRAIENNGFGIAGVAPGADVLSLVVCTPSGAGASDECRLSDLLRGVDVAWENGAQVLNMALVGPPNQLLRRAMDRLDQLGVLLVAAVGNEGVDEPRYPAAYPSVIGVGAVDREGQLYARGNRGPAVEVLAPGVEIVSTVPGDSFAFGDGTSLAAANVTGVLALAVAASGDPLAARTAFFQAARAESAALPIRVPKICAVLERLGKPCPKP